MSDSRADLTHASAYWAESTAEAGSASSAVLAARRLAVAPLRRSARNFHYLLTVILLLVLVPALRFANLPVRFTWVSFFTAYWLNLGAQSVFGAIILYLIALSPRDTLVPFVTRYRRQLARLLMLLPCLGLIGWLYGPIWGAVIAADGVALIELNDRLTERRCSPLASLRAVMVPAAYFFAGFWLVLAYNDVVASLRFTGSGDEALNRLDAWLMHGTTVPLMAHGALAHLPLWAFYVMTAVYFMMWPLVGACIAFLSLMCGTRRALQFVGATLTAYYIALALFYVLPTTGPYFVCPNHFATFPKSLPVYDLQRAAVTQLTALQHHRPPSVLGMDYFIGFPCMHITEPLIALWFVRRWRGLAVAVTAFNIALIPSILLLEQHYAVDLLAGAVVAAVAVLMVDGAAAHPASNSTA
jgi:PAP2 superfamily